MTSIAINPTCPDSAGCSDQVTVNVTCSCPNQPAPAAPRPRHEAELYGLSLMTLPPAFANYKTTGEITQHLIGASAILPAGAYVSSLGIQVASPGQGDRVGESRLGIYVGGIPELVASTADRPDMFTQSGWRWAPLDLRPGIAEEDRIIWLVALVPAFSVAPPQISAAAGGGLINQMKFRSVRVHNTTALPRIFDHDVVDMVAQPYLPMMATSPVPMSQ